ncbi:hypothetical protein PIB30_088443 [Stylosanthes scabra]|uniref:Uncharacterized protein n=1 Tax=Stylosanthes scabra TaxID=79078 RepID=A0ABU6ZSB2_9FABA|nr:hypothetical protein [Stylosanthes scabra]
MEYCFENALLGFCSKEVNRRDGEPPNRSVKKSKLDSLKEYGGGDSVFQPREVMMVDSGAGREGERREEDLQVVMSERRARNENEMEGPTAKRSYVSMVKGPDFVFHSESEDEDYSSEEMSESEDESEFDYSDEEGIKPGTEEWEDKRLTPRRKVVWDEEGIPTLMLNRAEQRRLNSQWCHTLVVKLMGRRIV